MPVAGSIRKISEPWRFGSPLSRYRGPGPPPLSMLTNTTDVRKPAEKVLWASRWLFEPPRPLIGYVRQATGGPLPEMSAHVPARCFGGVVEDHDQRWAGRPSPFEAR